MINTKKILYNGNYLMIDIRKSQPNYDIWMEQKVAQINPPFKLEAVADFIVELDPKNTRISKRMETLFWILHESLQRLLIAYKFFEFYRVK